MKLASPELEIHTGKLQMVASAVLQRFSSVYQRVSELLSVHAGETQTLVEQTSCTQAKNAVILTEETMTINGNAGTVQLSVSGQPSRSTATFSPTSVVNSGTSVLTIDTRSNVTRRTYTLTIRGTAGTIVHTTTATLIVR